MSNQKQANETFVNTVVSLFFKTAQNHTVSAFCVWLIKAQILPEKALNNWLAIFIYEQELAKTRSKDKPKGVKWIAENRAIEQVPISQRSLANLLKNQQRGERQLKAYFLQKNKV